MAEPQTESPADATKDIADTDSVAGAQNVADVTVIILVYSTERWSLDCAAVESALNQTLLPREIMVCVDDNAHRA
jgi:hypothetical protein